MSDLLHARIGTDIVQRVFATMADTPQHTYQVLTKRSSRLRRIAAELPWPPNVWMGVSVEDQTHAYRVGDLRGVPAVVRFVSAEPLLGPLTLDLNGVAWLIAGGESGPGHRPLDLDWVRSLRDQCASAQTRFFYKQYGGARPKTGGRLLDGREWNDMPHLDIPARAAAAESARGRDESSRINRGVGRIYPEQAMAGGDR